MNSRYVTLLLVLFIPLSFSQIMIDLIPSSLYNDQFKAVTDPNLSTKRVDDLFMMKVRLGYPPQGFHLLVDTTSYPMWIQSSDSTSKIPDCVRTFNKEASNTFKPKNEEISFHYAGNQCKGELIKERVVYANDKITMELPLVKEYSYHLWRMDGISGFAKKPIDAEPFTPSNSFVPALQEVDKIEQKIFSINHFINGTPKMFIGKEHKNFLNTENVVACHTIDSANGDWRCMLNQIIHNKTAIPIETEVIFDTTVEDIYFPESLKESFSKIISKKNCKEKNRDDGVYYDCLSLEDWLIFDLAFGESVLKLPQEMLIKETESKRLFMINIIFTTKYKEIRFGTSLYKYYHVQFDADENSIQFFAEKAKNVGHLKEYNLPVTKSTFDFIMMIVLIVGFLLTAFIAMKIIQSQLNKRNKKKRQVEEIDESKYTPMNTIKTKAST